MSEASKKAPLTTEEKRRAYAKAYYRKKKAEKAKAKAKPKTKAKVKPKVKAKVKAKAKVKVRAEGSSFLADLVVILLEQVRDMKIQLENKQ